MSRLSRLVLFIRPPLLPSSASFYSSVLSLPLLRSTASFAELRCPGSGVSLTLTASDSESTLSTGYSPFLTFTVPSLDHAVSTACQLGGELDGPVKFPAHGKVATLRTPDGHMLGLYEPVEDLGGVTSGAK